MQYGRYVIYALTIDLGQYITGLYARFICPHSPTSAPEMSFGYVIGTLSGKKSLMYLWSECFSDRSRMFLGCNSQAQKPPPERSRAVHIHWAGDTLPPSISCMSGFVLTC